MNNNKKFRKTLIVNIGIALAIIVPLLAGVLLLRSYLNQAASQIVKARRELTERTAELNTLVKLRGEYNSFGEPYLNVLRTVVPEKDRLINIAQEYQALAQEEKLGFGFSFRGETAPSGDKLGSVLFNITVTGDDIDEVVKFIEKLHNFHYLTTIESISLARRDNEMQATMTGSVYFR